MACVATWTPAIIHSIVETASARAWNLLMSKTATDSFARLSREDSVLQNQCSTTEFTWRFLLLFFTCLHVTVCPCKLCVFRDCESSIVLEYLTSALFQDLHFMCRSLYCFIAIQSSFRTCGPFVFVIQSCIFSLSSQPMLINCVDVWHR